MQDQINPAEREVLAAIITEIEAAESLCDSDDDSSASDEVLGPDNEHSPTAVAAAPDDVQARCARIVTLYSHSKQCSSTQSHI